MHKKSSCKSQIPILSLWMTSVLRVVSRHAPGLVNSRTQIESQNKDFYLLSSPHFGILKPLTQLSFSQTSFQNNFVIKDSSLT